MPSKAKTKKRCPWPGDDTKMIHYHDTEWGNPRHDDEQHFEFLVLEAAQAGLSWATIFKRRAGYRKAFANYNLEKIKKFDHKKITELMKNEGIIRNRLKIQAVIHNAPLFQKIQREFGSFDKYMWSFQDHQQLCPGHRHQGDLPATSSVSDAISKDLKKRGFKFVGSTVIYAHMQAVGMVNDHLKTCFRFKDCRI